MNIRKIAAVALLISTCLAPSIASAQAYDQNQNVKTAAPSAPVATYTMSGTCATPLSPGSAAVPGGAAATGCVAAGSAIILPTSGGYAGYAFQVNTPNGGTYQIESSIDCSTYFTSNVEVAGGSPSALSYSSTFTAAGKYTGAASAPCMALVATVAPTASTTVYGYLFQAPVGTILRGSIPLTTYSLGSTAATTNVAASASSVSLLAANSNRKNAYITNNSSTATMYVAFAATATASLFAFALPPGAEYEFGQTTYTGAVSAIWSAASGSATITEVTP